MKKMLTVAAMFLVMLFVSAASMCVAETASVKITDCRYSEPDLTLTVEYKFTKGPDADHVHPWIDGKETKPSAKEPDALKFYGVRLAKGEHKIELRVNNSAHKEVGISDTFKLVIK